MIEERMQSTGKKRLALFFDGTWNEPGNHTNVWRLYLMLAERSQDGIEQKSFYDEGVGTRFYDRVSGGAFGAGLSDNVRKGYRWLMEHYNSGDEIFLFGFSRGAFTARSLAGLIAKCGLLRPEAPLSFMQVYERYQMGDAAHPIHELIRKKEEQKDFTFEDKLLLRYSRYHRDFIKMVGVWDTVGSIGIPFGNIKGVSRRSLWFHYTNLSTTIHHSYQALAIDEQRRPYWAVLWNKFEPDHSDIVAATARDNRVVEQRWFSGAHANVGGGYRSDLLPQRPLAWMQEKATNCGLTFRSQVCVTNDDLNMQPRDSYSEFLRGTWKTLTFGRRYIRPLMAEPVVKMARTKGEVIVIPGKVGPVNERIDISVFKRCQRHSQYRPASLIEWAQRKGLDIKKIIDTPENFPELWLPVTTVAISATHS